MIDRVYGMIHTDVFCAYDGEAAWKDIREAHKAWLYERRHNVIPDGEIGLLIDKNDVLHVRASRRVLHLAFHARKIRTRKKNMARSGAADWDTVELPKGGVVG